MQFVLKKSIGLVAQGKAALDPYSFDYLLYVTRFVVHRNMQMKIIVDTPEDL
jgi:cytochrome c oxidase subunit 2